MVREHSEIQDKILKLLTGDKMTIGIAAICEANTSSPKIVFCADRLVSGKINFENGIPKLKLFTVNCWVMTATNDGLKSDMIIENVKGQISGQKLSVKEIVELISLECKKFAIEELDRNVFADVGIDYATYNKNIEKYSADFFN